MFRPRKLGFHKFIRQTFVHSNKKKNSSKNCFVLLKNSFFGEYDRKVQNFRKQIYISSITVCVSHCFVRKLLPVMIPVISTAFSVSKNLFPAKGWKMWSLLIRCWHQIVKLLCQQWETQEIGTNVNKGAQKYYFILATFFGHFWRNRGLPCPDSWVSQPRPCEVSFQAVWLGESRCGTLGIFFVGLNCRSSVFLANWFSAFTEQPFLYYCENLLPFKKVIHCLSFGLMWGDLRVSLGPSNFSMRVYVWWFYLRWCPTNKSSKRFLFTLQILLSTKRGGAVQKTFSFGQEKRMHYLLFSGLKWILSRGNLPMCIADIFHQMWCGFPRYFSFFWNPMAASARTTQVSSEICLWDTFCRCRNFVVFTSYYYWKKRCKIPSEMITWWDLWFHRSSESKTVQNQGSFPWVLDTRYKLLILRPVLLRGPRALKQLSLRPSLTLCQ